jgi:hypothetical protein
MVAVGVTVLVPGVNPVGRGPAGEVGAAPGAGGAGCLVAGA